VAGQQGPDDIERLLREMEALTGQADAALGAGDRSPAPAAPRPGVPAAPDAQGDAGGGAGRLLQPLLVSAAATVLVTVAAALLAVLPFVARPGITDVAAIFLASFLVALFYRLRG
jgi:hypothetical protein